MKYDDVPWADSSKWKSGCWYPLPVTSVWCHPDKCNVVEGYDLFTQHPVEKEDILPIENDVPMTFKQAVRVCEAHNGWKFDLE